ncbi:hypothetical protein B0H13DRAFT_1869700 [Mycena leptocephala]|nr:hypothetical protein B0H13DRAFT_1869700 [Mycena leptocephala]
MAIRLTERALLFWGRAEISSSAARFRSVGARERVEVTIFASTSFRERRDFGARGPGSDECSTLGEGAGGDSGGGGGSMGKGSINGPTEGTNSWSAGECFDLASASWGILTRSSMPRGAEEDGEYSVNRARHIRKWQCTAFDPKDGTLMEMCRQGIPFGVTGDRDPFRHHITRPDHFDRSRDLPPLDVKSPKSTAAFPPTVKCG